MLLLLSNEAATFCMVCLKLQAFVLSVGIVHFRLGLSGADQDSIHSRKEAGFPVGMCRQTHRGRFHKQTLQSPCAAPTSLTRSLPPPQPSWERLQDTAAENCSRTDHGCPHSQAQEGYRVQWAVGVSTYVHVRMCVCVCVCVGWGHQSPLPPNKHTSNGCLSNGQEWLCLRNLNIFDRQNGQR